ncbi:spore photoproduct lyase [Candidatus Termititenax persephonae]|uniref:Spore photoproduct lyase n=1 Tax=Candidatus Termititenax persephonae TaxID=2218525 RepID=A0A388THR5_9BACT|nr:spore photoproduct lyase [Candidatus Termititenax persephonae]
MLSEPASLIYIERAVAALPYTQMVLQNFPGARLELIDNLRAVVAPAQAYPLAPPKQAQPLILARQRGRFLKKCPGTKEHICCNYHTLNIAVGCPYDCTYCFLQSYSNTPFYTIYTNLDEMLAEIKSQVKGKIRLGTGELTDSLAMERRTHFVREYVPQICAISPEITLELKTKSNWTLGEDEASLLAQFRSQLVFAWSVNPQDLIDSDEYGTAPLLERIHAAQTAAASGYRVALHFDPIIYGQDWAERYQVVLDLLKVNIPPEQIAWLSLGTFRFTPALKPIVERRFPDSTLVYGELFPGRDRKMRYPEPIRVKIYRQLLKQIAAISPRIPVYLCMESPEVWQKVYNRLPRQVENLSELF